MLPKVSILMPTYNCGKYIGPAIESILQQTYTDFELLVLDDGSGDNTTEVVAGFSSDPRVIYIKLDHQGVAMTRNYGLDVAKGDFIAFCDADDTWTEKKLGNQLAIAMNDESVTAVYTNMSRIDESGNITLPKLQRRLPEGNITTTIFLKNYVPFASLLVKKKGCPDLPRFNPKRLRGSDAEWTLRLTTTHKFAAIDESLYQYRTRHAQITALHHWIDYREDILTDFVKDHPNAVPRPIVKHRFAEMHRKKGKILIKELDEPGKAFGEFLKGLKYKPFSLKLYGGLLRAGCQSLIPTRAK